MEDFNDAAAERPWRKQRVAEKGSEVRDLLPGAGGSNIFVRSVALADRVQIALASAATAKGCTQEEMSELLDRLNGFNELSAVSAVSRAEVIRILAQDRSISEIEVIAPELGKLATMHASDIVGLAGDFDLLLHLAGLPATESPRIAAELHAVSAGAGLPLSDAVQAFVTLAGDVGTDGDQVSPGV
jgi:hypothetical protein